MLMLFIVSPPSVRIGSSLHFFRMFHARSVKIEFPVLGGRYACYFFEVKHKVFVVVIANGLGNVEHLSFRLGEQFFSFLYTERIHKIVKAFTGFLLEKLTEVTCTY